MLYQIHEFQRAMLTPLSAWAESTAQLYTNPYSPLTYTPMARRIAAALDLTHRLGKDYEKPEWRINQVETAEGPVNIRPSEVEIPGYHQPFCKLIHFDRLVPEGQTVVSSLPKVLVVAPLSGHHSTLLRDTVRRLLIDHDVTITDWVDARMVPITEGPFGLDDYVETIRQTLRMMGPDVHVISVCQPTVPVLAAISLMSSAGEPQAPRTMTMMGGPIDTRKCPTEVNNLATHHNMAWFERNVIYNVPQRYPGYLRRVYPGFLQHAGFVAMNPNRHMTSHWDYFQNLIKGDDPSTEAHREFYDEYNAVLDLAAEFYLDTIRVVFQEHLLPKGSWVVKGEPVRPQDIDRTALLTIEGQLDDISGLGQTRAAQGLCSKLRDDQKEHMEIQGAGHYGIFSGRRWRTLVAPRIGEFIRKHAAG